MSSSMPALPGLTPKSFWERPEGPTAKALLWLMIGGAGVGLYFLLPFIITLLSSALMATGLAVALGLSWLIILKFHKLIVYMFRGLARTIAKLYTEVDPIGIMDSYVKDLKVLLENMDNSLRELRAKRKRLDMDIAGNKAQIQESLSLAARAKKEGMKTQVVLKSRKAGRLTESNLTLEGLAKKMEMIQKVLDKMRDVCDFLIQDTTDEIDMRVKEYKAVQAAESAVSAAMKLVRGQTASRELFDMAVETVADRVARGYAEIEHFTSMSRNFIDSVDLQNGVFEENALNMLEDWEKKADSIILGDDKQRIIAAAESGDSTFDLTVPAAPVAASTRMRSLIQGMGGGQN